MKPRSEQVNHDIEPAQSEQIFDLSGALQRLGGDRNLLADLVQLLEEDSPKLLELIARGIDARAVESVQLAAHSLRGLISNFGAPSLMRILTDLEDAATRDDFQAASSALNRAREQVERLRASVAPYGNTSSG